MTAFLRAFADAAGLEPGEADEQWAFFSRQLSDRERERIERGGARSGRRMGLSFLALYPLAERGQEAT